MGDQVIADEERNLDESPVEGDGAAAGAGSPSGPLVADLDPLDCQLVRVKPPGPGEAIPTQPGSGGDVPPSGASPCREVEPEK